MADKMDFTELKTELDRMARVYRAFRMAQDVANSLDGLNGAKDEVDAAIEAKNQELTMLKDQADQARAKVDEANQRAADIIQNAQQKSSDMVEDAKALVDAETAKLKAAKAEYLDFADDLKNIEGQKLAADDELERITQEIEARKKAFAQTANNL